MNRWISKVVTVASVVGALALVSSGVALAHDGGGHGHGHHRGNLVSAALKLDSLSDSQRTSVQQLEATQKAAMAPVRQADATVLTALAQQVDQNHIDPAALKDSLSAEDAAAQAARNVDIAALGQLHSLLSAQQRNQLVDAIEARMPQGKTHPALESFRGDSFDAGAMVRTHVPGERAIAMAEKKVPGMTAEERAAFATHLRERASRESKG